MLEHNSEIQTAEITFRSLINYVFLFLCTRPTRGWSYDKTKLEWQPNLLNGWPWLVYDNDWRSVRGCWEKTESDLESQHIWINLLLGFRLNPRKKKPKLNSWIDPFIIKCTCCVPLTCELVLLFLRVLSEDDQGAATGVKPRYMWTDHSLPVTDVCVGRCGVSSWVATASRDMTCIVSNVRVTWSLKKSWIGCCILRLWKGL